MIQKHVLFIFIIIFLAADEVRTEAFPLSLWKDFHLNSREIVLSHSLQHHKITFHDRIQQDWTNTYSYSEQAISIQFTKGFQTLQVLGHHQMIAIRGLIQGESLSLSHSLLAGLNSHQVYLIHKGQFLSQDLPIRQYNILKVVGFDSIVYKVKQSQFAANFTVEKQRIKLSSELKMHQFLNLHKINETYLTLAQHTLSQTISSLCIQQHKHEYYQQNYYGLCFNIHEGKRHSPVYIIDVRYSFLIIDRLFAGYQETAFFLFEQMINLLEDRLFYSDGHFIQIPEHIAIIRMYIESLEKTTLKPNVSEVSKLNAQVKSLLNGLMNQMLLSDVNSLEEQINYRENKKLHPTLLKMLSLKWKSNSLKNAISSIYEESFTPDYFYNNANQKTDTCISKISWLAAAALEYVLFINKHGSEDDRDAIQQPKSLFKILLQFTNNDEHAKKGRYFSINSADGIRVYANQIGYESLMPFIYQVSNIYPEEMVRNITTHFGLASLNQDHTRYNQKFQFRGNIHLYFNYKLLVQSRVKLNFQKKKVPQLDFLINSVREQVKRSWSSGRTYTMWTTSGKGLRNRRDISLLNLLILSDQ